MTASTSEHERESDPIVSAEEPDVAGLRVCIHRGAREVGGSCVELESSGKRLVIDIGRPLGAPLNSRIEVPGVTDAAPGTLLGVVISHPHQDHYGLMNQLETSVPVYIGSAAASILDSARFFAPSGMPLRATGFLVDREPLRLDPFVVTPYLVDHSAFDSYALLIEANGRRLFYSGDFRAHGRKSSLAVRLREETPESVHVLLLEGTHVRVDGQASGMGMDETGVELAMAAAFRSAKGLVNVFSAAQNIDRLVTIYRACKRAGRTLVIDLYTATIAAATGRDTIPQPGFPNLRVYVPNRQRILVKNSAEYSRVEAIRHLRVFLEDIRRSPSQFVMILQGSTLSEIARSGCLQDAAAIWSLWAGYLEQPAGARCTRMLKEYGVPMTHLHASGHASIADLQALAAAFAPARVVPIHSGAPGRFAELFDNVEQHEDGEWWAA